MKEIRKYFNEYKQIFPNLSSFMWLGKACRQTQPTRRQIINAFRELVDQDDYSKSDTWALIDHLCRMAEKESTVQK